MRLGFVFLIFISLVVVQAQEVPPTPPPWGSESYDELQQPESRGWWDRPDRRCKKWFEECQEECVLEVNPNPNRPDKSEFEYRKCLFKRDQACQHFYEHPWHHCENYNTPETPIPALINSILLISLLFIFLKVYQKEVFV